MGSANALRLAETTTMAMTFTASSGSATPKIECMTSAVQGLSGAATIEANGARKSPNSEMLAAPSRKAVQTWAGGPGRSSAAMTSHSSRSAGATAAVPTTVGNASSRFIRIENRFPRPSYPLGQLRRCVMHPPFAPLSSTAAADSVHARRHLRILVAERVHVFHGIDLRPVGVRMQLRALVRGDRRRDLVVAGQPFGRIGDRPAFR